MDTVAAVTLAISLVSLTVSALAAYFSHGIAARQIRLANRNEFSKLLLEVNRELVRDPFLNYYRDSRRPPGLPPFDHLQAAKLDSFGYILLNVAELIFDYHTHAGRRSAAERRGWESWRGVFRDLLGDSSVVRGLLGRPETAAVYSPEFVALLTSLLPAEPAPAAG